MHVAAGEVGDLEVNRLPIGGDGDFLNFGCDLVDFWTAVSFLVDVGPGTGFVGADFLGARAIDGLGKGDDKAVGLGVHFVHFKRRLAGPADSLKGEVLSTSGGPSAVGASDEKGRVFAHAGRDDAAAEVFEEFPNSALIEAVNFFKIDALNLRVGLFADEDLSLEGTELSFGRIIDHGGGRLSDFAVRKDDGRRNDAGVFVTFGDHA